MNDDPLRSDAAAKDQAGTTHFGFTQVREDEKARQVAGVFHSVARKYDVMNDVMSAGLHRWWKAFTIRQANVRPGMKVLDIAGGTGDLALRFARQAGRRARSGSPTSTPPC
jgi:demethylmenaquinone methyltransferase / 2-methoxy-6-polyprenyl-1,4-benzoquinol methylase